MATRWLLRAYERDGDALCEEHALPGVTAQELRALLGAPAEDPLYDSFPIGPEGVAALGRRFALALPAADRAYFIECEAAAS